jgi:hypothetical protein
MQSKARAPEAEARVRRSRLSARARYTRRVSFAMSWDPPSGSVP